MKLSVRTSLALAATAAAAVGAQGVAFASPTGTPGTLTYTHTLNPNVNPESCPASPGINRFTPTFTVGSSSLRAAAPSTTLVRYNSPTNLEYAAKVTQLQTVKSMTNNITLVGLDTNNKAVQCAQIAAVAAPTVSGQDSAAQVLITSPMPAGVAHWQATVNGVVANTDNTFFRFNETTDVA